MIYLGVDWAETHHDLCLLDEQGQRLARERINDNLEGLRRLHELVAEHAQEPGQVVIGIEIDHGLLVTALSACGYQIYPINPRSVERYRDRHSVSGAKSDKGDAKLLADLVRTDRHNHRPMPEHSTEVAALKVLTRAHKELIWSRQRQVNQLRSALREFFPAALEAFGKDLAAADALAVLSSAPTPERARLMPKVKIIAALRKGGRQRYLEQRSAELREIFTRPQLEQPPAIARAQGLAVAARVANLHQLNHSLAELEEEMQAAFEVHPDAKIYRSLPGLGVVLGARVLAESGDDPDQYPDARARKSDSGTAPVTRASGKSRIVHLRQACNHHLRDACRWWAFSALMASPGARRYYDQLRARGKSHEIALRQLANRLVGILHGCLRRRELYDENIAWPPPDAVEAA
jgi:transposase